MYVLDVRLINFDIDSIKVEEKEDKIQAIKT
jgi:hypothetical protein